MEDFFQLEDEEKQEFFQRFSQSEISLVALYANRFPSLQMQVSKLGSSATTAEFKVELVRENIEEEEKLSNYCSNGLLQGQELWWIVIWDASSSHLFHVEKVYLEQSLMREFSVSLDQGHKQASFLLICDSYVGADINSEAFVL